MPLYHIYNRENHESIISDGLRGVDWDSRFHEWGLPVNPVDARDMDRPDAANDMMEVGRAIVEHIFEDERPPDRPTRTNTVFCYADRNYMLESLDSEFNAACLDADSVSESLVCGNDEWKTHVMRRTIACVRGEPVTIHESHLRDAARSYWRDTYQWPNRMSSQIRLEIFGAEYIPVDAIQGVIDGQLLKTER